jgi:hypothetical protein
VRKGQNCSANSHCFFYKNVEKVELEAWTSTILNEQEEKAYVCSQIPFCILCQIWKLALLKKNEKKKLARSVNFTFRYIDDVRSLNNSRFVDSVDRIYRIELEIKNITYADRSASYLDLHLEINSEGRLRTKHYDKRDDFDFPIVNFPFICSNIPVAPVYGVLLYSSVDTLFQSSRACGSCQNFNDRGLLLKG